MDNKSTAGDGDPPKSRTLKAFVEDSTMKDFDFGYFGIGDEGYAQYMTAFERNFSTDNTDRFASDDADCDADSCDGSEEDF